MALVTVHQTAVDLIAEFEGLRLNAYVDPATGGEPITIGFGHTSAAGFPPVKMGMRITAEEAKIILKHDLEKFADGVFKAVSVPLNPYQFGALVSLAFNIGLGNFRKSSLLMAVNAGDFETAAAKFALYNRANKKVMAGLTRRRAAEAALFVRPIAEPVKPSPAPVTPPPILDDAEVADRSPRKGLGFVGWLIVGTLIVCAIGWFVFFVR